MGSRSRRYRRSLRCHRRFLQSYRRFLLSYHRSRRHCGDPRGDRRRRSLRDSLNIIKHSKTSWNTCKTLWNIVKRREPLVKHHETLKTLWNIMKQSSFNATISALDAETSSLDGETSVIARSCRRYRCGVYGDIGDCGVGITPQMCNRVANHGDMSTFSKPAWGRWGQTIFQLILP